MNQRTILNVGQNYRVVGGSDKYLMELGKLLERKGSLVIPFASKNGENERTPWEDYFPETFNLKDPKIHKLHSFYYSVNAKRNLQKLLSNQRIDIAHLHIIYGTLTESILNILGKNGIPIVQSLHEYRLACPVYTMVRHGEVCSLCEGKDFYKALLYRCNRGSLLRSFFSMSSSYVSKWFGSHSKIDRFIAVSNFMKIKMEQIGIDPVKIDVVHNFVDTDTIKPKSSKGNYFLYFGRVEKVKGIETLLKAGIKSNANLVIAGEGSYLNHLRSIYSRYDNINFVGFKQGHELEMLMDESIATVIPSEWYENCPLSVLESFAYGKPVIGSRIGGIPELIVHGENGLLFEPGNVDQLAENLRFFSQSKSVSKFGKNARIDAEKKFGPEEHYHKINKIYDQLIR